MELGLGLQADGPLGEVLVVLPGLRELGIVVLAGMRIVADQRLHRRQALAHAVPEDVGVGERRVEDDDHPLAGQRERRGADEKCGGEERRTGR
jgi:hypothetical protein